MYSNEQFQNELHIEQPLILVGQSSGIPQWVLIVVINCNILDMHTGVRVLRLALAYRWVMFNIEPTPK